MKTVYDSIAEHIFKKDGEGRSIFFPMGAFGLKKPGYIIPTEEKKDEIKKIYKYYSNALFTVFLLSFVLRRETIIFISLLATLFIVHFVLLHMKVNKAIVGLQKSDMPLPPVNKREAWTVGLIGFSAIFIMAFSVFVFVFGIRAAGTAGILIGTGSIFILLFVVIAVAYFLTMKKRGTAGTNQH